MKGLTQAEFARRAGVTQTTISKALRAGRLALLPTGGVDPHFLEKQWRAQPASAKATPSRVDGPAQRKPGRPVAKPTDAAGAKLAANFAAAALVKAEALAGLRRLDFEQRASLLIPLDTAKEVLFAQAHANRDVWLNWPARIAPRLAARLGVAPDALLHELTLLVHEQCARLGDPDGDFARVP